MIIKILLILLIAFGVIALSFIVCFGPYCLIIARIYCYEAIKYLKYRKEKKLDKISIKQLHRYVKYSLEYDWAKENPFNQIPIFSHCALVFYIVKDIFILIFKIFKLINKYTYIFTYIWKFIKYIWQNIHKLILLILKPFIWIKNKLSKLINYLINIKFI